MAINAQDGRYALEFWIDSESTDDPDGNEFSDDLKELVERALIVLKAARFNFIAICEFSYVDQEYRDLWLLPDDIDDVQEWLAAS